MRAKLASLVLLFAGAVSAQNCPCPPTSPNIPFPVAIYSVPESQMTTLGPNGFAILANPYWAQGSASAIVFLDQAKAAGKLGIIGFETAKLAARDNVYIQTYVAAVKNHPALYAYYASDETQASAADAEWAYNTIRAADAAHPIIFTHWIPTAPTTYKNAYDIYWHDVYPVGSLTNWPVGQWGSWVADQAKLASPKPFWAIVQAYGTADSKWIEPTPDELRVMTYLSLVAGSKGVVFYQHCDSWCSYYIRNSPAFWDYVKLLSSELKDNQAMLAAIASTRIVTSSSPSVKLLLKEVGGKLFLVAVNTANATPALNYHYPGVAQNAVKFTVADMRMADVKLVGVAGRGSGAAGRQLPLVCGVFEDNFTPYAVHVYEITPSG